MICVYNTNFEIFIKNNACKAGNYRGKCATLNSNFLNFPKLVISLIDVKNILNIAK